MKNSPVIVGVSYGVDSMVTLHQLSLVYSEIHVVHINHHQREASFDEERLLKEYCQKNNFYFHKFDFYYHKGNFQNAARLFRYNCYREIYERVGAKQLFLGHHLQDVVETILSKMFYGGTISTYYGFKAEMYNFGMHISRPLIFWSKKEIYTYAKIHAVPFLEDSSNIDCKYRRNKIRYLTAQLDLDSYDSIRKFYETQLLISEYLHEKAMSYIVNGQTINLTDIKEIELIFAIEEVLRKLEIALDLSGTVKRIVEFWKSPSERLQISKNFFVYLEDNQLVFEEEYIREYDFIVRKNEILELPFAKFYLGNFHGYRVRNYREGDKILLSFGHKRVSRCFIDRKLRKRYRSSWPVIVDETGEIIAVIGLGYQKKGFEVCNTNIIMLKYLYAYGGNDYMINDVEKVLITYEEIIERTKQLGRVINEDYADSENLILLGLLKGSIPFLAHLMNEVDLYAVTEFMDVSSYHGTAQSTGEVKILKDIDVSVQGKDILIVEDVVDTGTTLATVKKLLEDRGAKSVKIITLLDKPGNRVTEVIVDYVGFTIGNDFVIGFGLDYQEKYRNLKYIGILKKEIYSKEDMNG